jgi:hypothetical protein
VVDVPRLMDGTGTLFGADHFVLFSCFFRGLKSFGFESCHLRAKHYEAMNVGEDERAHE